MKTNIIKAISGILLLASVLIGFLSCEDRDFDSPYDPEVNIESLVPYNLAIEDISIIEKKLTWQCDAENAEQFIIDKKVEDENWQEAYAEVSGDTYAWTDRDIELSKTHQYQVKAKFDEKITKANNVEFEAIIPAPENFEITANSLSSVTLNWNYNHSGHDSFKIDRKVDDGSWETGYQIVDATITSLTDEVDLGNHVYTYRITAILENYQSIALEQEANFFFTDPRDGQTYETVEIGNQVWFAENLNYETENYWWYDNDPDNGDTYGRLYTWEAALDACPDGWHLPTDKEWKTLEMELGMSQSEADATGYRGTDQGEQMKSSSGWNNNGNGTNSSGFNALPGGTRSSYRYFSNVGSNGYWWSATEYYTDYVWSRYLYYSSSRVSRFNYGKADGFSVRCLRD
jgi:uncharacterized protein (TIGR02145 family)